jgi:hypothetical protein
MPIGRNLHARDALADRTRPVQWLLTCLRRLHKPDQISMRRTRRDPRYLLSRPWEGTLSIPGDVVVERQDAERKELWVLSAVPAHREERLTLDLSGPRESFAVRVVESRPVLIDGCVRHRLRLAIVE